MEKIEFISDYILKDLCEKQLITLSTEFQDRRLKFYGVQIGLQQILENKFWKK